MSSTMQAVVSSLPDPSKRQTAIGFDPSYAVPKPAAGELLVQVLASPINPSDLLNAKGDFPQTTFPRVPGRDFAGIVTAPAGHPLYQKHVFGTSGREFSFTKDGAHAEYISVNPEGVAELPDGVDPKAASTMGTPWTTAYLALTRSRPQKGDTVMVFGAGGAVGSAVVQLAKSSLFGCRVLRGGRGDKYDVDTAKYPGLDVVKDLTGGKGVDVVVDTTGDFSLMKAALGKMAFGGRLAVITTGASAGRTETVIDVDLKALYRAEHCIIGCNSVDHSQEEMAGFLRLMSPLLDSGELKAPDVSRYAEVSLQEAVNAYEDMKKGSRTKYIVVRK